MPTLLLLLFACTAGDGTDSATDSATDSGTDSGCLAAWSDGSFALDPDGPATQLHPSLAWDGQRLWTAWVRPDDGSRFDIWLAARDCGGGFVVDPVEVTQTDDNELDPTVAAGDAGVLVAWTSDNGASADNLDIRTRSFDLDGSPRTDAVDLVAERNGRVVTGNATSPVVDIDGTGFHLAGSWGHEDATAFQAFGLPLDSTGLPDGPALDLAATENGGQLAVTTAAAGERRWHAWEESDPVDFSASVLLAEQGAAPTALGPGMRPHLAATAAGVWAAWDDEAGTISLRSPDGAVSALELGAGFHFQPRLATADDSLAVAWMTLESGFYATLSLAWLTPDGAVDAVVEVAGDDVASPYGIELVLVDPDHAVVVWADGENPDFQVRGARLSRP